MNARHYLNVLIFPLGIITLLLISGCHKNSDPATLTLNTQLKWNGVNLAVGDTVFDSNNNSIRVERFSTYISNISLKPTNGDWINSLSISLLDFLPTTASASALYIAPMIDCNNEFDSIRFSIGVPSELNEGVDPAMYENSHPLSVQGSAGMHWSLEIGYFFTKLEGKVSADIGAPIDVPFAMHTATNFLYRDVTLALPTNLNFHPNDSKVYNLDLDLALIINSSLENIDPNNIAHTMGNVPLAVEFVDLFSKAWSFSE